MEHTGAARRDEAHHDGGAMRTARILGFLFKYRKAGVFEGLYLDDLHEHADHPANRDTRPEQFVNDLEALGPTFVKIGQALSTRPDMVPPDYLAALERMQDDVAPIDPAVVRGLVEEELGVRLGKVFTEFDDVPLGCASLAQVHRAVLRDGREVAVKVQRPEALERIRGDLDALAAIARRVDHNTRVGQRMRFTDWIHEFRRTLLAELDYRAEADNLSRFAEHLRAYPELVVPAPMRDLSTGRVLTMELVTGTKVTSITGLRRTECSLGGVAEALMRGYLDQAFVHGEIHADPHPGNLLLTPDNRLAIFDLGMVAHIPPRQRDHLLKLLFAAVDGRGEDVAGEGIAMGTRLSDFDEERYLREIGQLVARYAARQSTPGGGHPLSEGRLVLDLTRIATACGLRTPPELSLLGKTLLNLEAVSTALDPDMDVKCVVRDHLESVMRQRMRRTFSAAALAGEMIEVQELVREAPRQLTNILSLLGDNRMQVRVAGLDDSQLLEALQKIANRITTGVVIAALILASALVMRGGPGSGPTLFGYPAIALVLFLVGAGLGLYVVVSALVRDRRARPREQRAPR